MIEQLSELGTRAAAADQRAALLADEAAALADQIAAHDARIAEHQAQADKFAPAIKKALDQDDSVAYSAAREQQMQAEDAMRGEAHHRGIAQARLDEIGDPDGPGLIADAAGEAITLRARAWQMLADSPETMATVRADELARAAAIATAERKRVEALLGDMVAAMPRVLAELARRLTDPRPFWSPGSDEAIIGMQDAIRHAARLTAADGVPSLLADLDHADPATLPAVLNRARQVRRELSDLVTQAPPPLEADSVLRVQ